MMEAENNVLALKSGGTAVRAHDLEKSPDISQRSPERADCISDSLGFNKLAMKDQQKILKESGCRGIEFREDPEVKGFIQVHCSSQEAKLKYAAARGLYDRNSINGGAAVLGEAGMRDAIELANRGRSQQHPIMKVETNG